MKSYCQVDESKNIFNKKNISIITLSGIYTFAAIESHLTWWKDDFNTFKFYNKAGKESWLNEPTSLGIDKVGHFYTSYLFFHLQKDLLIWGGHSTSFSKWFSASLTAVFAIMIEVGDSFSDYGFDYQDLIFNFGGIGYGILQEEYPFFNNFMFKWSYFPSDGLKFPPKFTEHYDSHIYWFAADIHNLFKNSIGDYWPKSIQPAVGFSVANNGTSREFILGLDFNFDFLFENKDENWQFFGKSLRMFHIPAPGVKFSPNTHPDYSLLLLN